MIWVKADYSVPTWTLSM